MTAPTGSSSPTRDDTLRALEYEVGVLLRRVRRVVSERARMLHPDLNATGYYLVATLIHSGAARATTLADLYELDKGAVSRLVHQLETLGLIERRPDPEDGRASILEATPLAQERMEQVGEARRREISAKLEDWGPGQLEQLVQRLGEYNSALAELDGPD